MLSRNKTKIICTIGPASRSPEMVEKMILAGMNIARLNFSHGDFVNHHKDVKTIRRASEKLGRPVAIMADLPGPKIRIGDLEHEEIELLGGQSLILTSKMIAGTKEKISVNLPELANIVTPGGQIFINDGFIQLHVNEVSGDEVHCTVIVGGQLRSRKGLNIPDVDLGISAFTKKDRTIAKFAMEIGVDALSQSFVENSQDIIELREMAQNLGNNPFIIAKIERSQAVKNLDAILKEADGIMVARGDLGVEIPISRIPVVQKEIVRKANQVGKPVITATHMLESMISNRLPTRAEATDVANAILDGSDCVMLSGESAVGKFPVEAVTTLCDIATEVESNIVQCSCHEPWLDDREQAVKNREIIASSVERAVHRLHPAVVVVPTRSGATARNISRYRLKVWVLGVSARKKTCQDLIFSHGTLPIHEPKHPDHWRKQIRQYFKQFEIVGDRAILTEGPSSTYPDRNERMEIIDVTRE